MFMTIRDRMAASPKAYSAVFISLICLGITFCEWVFAYQDVAYGVVLALFLALIIYAVLPV